ncbi:helix-turn-helix domain protein [Burkholderia oklahomensis]|uniref:Helix-turn-helix domain protein n=1 Tax=Burkholderia oklahomensis TaxID=342113 RepID=A0AAI8BCV9_9BURK|nr:helix-turn-helix domain protein [Burkholderia oklahomensis]
MLAEAGLLDGLRATTHWLGAAELARRYPSVSVDANVLFVDNGQVLTSAGASAALDLCLHMIRCDYGAAVAADAARLAVTPLVRDGGQAQFIAGEPPRRTSTLHALMEWLQCNLREPLTLDAIARQGAMSVRTLTRRFQEQAGTSPLQWLQTARVRRAQQLLETTALSVEQIATEAGFGSATAFRERFVRIVGTTPKRYRQAFRAQAA